MPIADWHQLFSQGFDFFDRKQFAWRAIDNHKFSASGT
jgi:hypothetical protein